MLPPSLGRWTDLWDAMDLLAFVTSGMCRLHDGTTPVDVPFPAPASGVGWGRTHSAYRELPLVATEMGKAMAAALR